MHKNLSICILARLWPELPGQDCIITFFNVLIEFGQDEIFHRPGLDDRDDRIVKVQG
jgi:hypothetical protein